MELAFIYISSMFLRRINRWFAPLKETYYSNTYSAAIKNGVIYLSLTLWVEELLEFWEFWDSADVYFRISKLNQHLLIALLIESFIVFYWFDLDYFDPLSAVDFY